MSLYRYLGQVIGEHSWDWQTFILRRKSRDIKIRKHPDTIGISREILEDLDKKGCRLILVRIDGRIMLKTDPQTWLRKGLNDRLSPDQEMHSFLFLEYFRAMNPFAVRLFHVKRAEPEIPTKPLNEFVMA